MVSFNQVAFQSLVPYVVMRHLDWGDVYDEPFFDRDTAMAKYNEYYQGGQGPKATILVDSHFREEEWYGNADGKGRSHVSQTGACREERQISRPPVKSSSRPLQVVSHVSHRVCAVDLCSLLMFAGVLAFVLQKDCKLIARVTLNLLECFGRARVDSLAAGCFD